MEALEIGLITAMGCILFLSLFGNILLCIVVHNQLSYQAVRNYSYLILNLAISDILLAGSSIPFDIVQRLKAPFFPFGATMCKLLWPFQTVCSMASIFTVGALSYQRYRLVVRPFKGKLAKRRFLIMLACIWLLPVLLAGLPYSFVLRFDGNSSFCLEEWIPQRKQDQLKLGFTTYLFIIQYVLPLSLIVWCNVQAIVKLKRYLKYRRRTSIICAQPIEHHENTVKMLTAIMAIFALFWLPGQIMHFLLEFQRNNEFILNYGLDIGYLFAFTNCVMNPLMFAYFTQCHKSLPMLRKITSTASTVECEFGFSTFKRESESTQERRRSLPSVASDFKRRPLSKTIKRPSLPILLRSKSLTVEQRRDLLASKGNSSKTSPGISPRKRKLPILTEVPDLNFPVQNGDLQLTNETSNQILDKSQNSDLIFQGNLQAQNSLSGSHKKLSFSLKRHNPASVFTDNTSESENLICSKTDDSPKETRGPSDGEKRISEPEKRVPLTEKQTSFSSLKKGSSIPGPQRDSRRVIETERNDEIRNFVDVMKTMREDVLRRYLDATPETELK